MSQTEFKKLIDDATVNGAVEWQNKGCVEGQAMFENARTRWAKLDYYKGAALPNELLLKALEALERYELTSLYKLNGKSSYFAKDAIAEIRAALERAGK